MHRPNPDAPAATVAPSTAQLAAGFLWLGLTGFGGVLPLARHALVERRRWLSEAEFADLLGLCQFLPGGNVINLSIAVGQKFRGVRGAVAALFGLLAAPTLIVVALGVAYGRYAADARVRHLFAGLAAAAAGLLISAAVKIARPLAGKPLAMALAAVTFAAIALLRLPLLPALLVLVAAGSLAAWRLAR
jgi:chromate transporter